MVADFRTEDSLNAMQGRHIRVFISSTFRDMQEERDHLIKIISPQLRKLCEDRGVTWDEVDLRWGITDEEAAEGKVLPNCLEEINRCRPYFIGLLGDRYGWVPQHILDELLERQPWLREHRERSVTELEILYGVLLKPQLHGHGYFFFRDSNFLPRDWLPSGQNLAPESEAASKKLELLKDRIRRASDAGICRLRENYKNSIQLGQWILEAFTELVNDLFPEDQQPHQLDRDAADHEAFALSRSTVYVRREEYFERLDAHAAHAAAGPALAVLGDSGGGKSALLANWAFHYRSKHPDDLLLLHFIGATAQGSDLTAMLRRILSEFKRRFDIDQDLPDTPQALRSTFGAWLLMVSARGRVVLILDALNQLEDRDGALDLIWLPVELPANVCLIVSTLPGRPLDAVQKSGWLTLRAKPLEVAERTQLLKQYLAQYAKSLSPARSDRIISAPQSSNPLFLRVLLEELRLFGEHDRLDERIGYYLSAVTPAELYQKILERYEQDYQAGRPELVRDAMILLWAGRRGLSEVELLELLGEPGQPLARIRWSPLFLAAEQSFISRSGLIGFANDYLRQAVAHRYLGSRSDEQSAHVQLARYFVAGQPGKNLPWQPGPRQQDEIPWQLAAASEWQLLFELLSIKSFFFSLWWDDEFEAKRYWARLEEHSFSMVQAYRKVLAEPESDPIFAFLISILLMHAGHNAEALLLLDYLVGYFRRNSDVSRLRFCLVNEAVILREQGGTEKATELLKEAELLSTGTDENEGRGLRLSLHNQAVILRERGDLAGAMALLKRVEQLCRDQGDTQSLLNYLCEQALVLEGANNPDGAMALQKQVELLCRELNDKSGLANCLGNQARIIHKRGHHGDLDKALCIYEQVEQLFQELGDKNGRQKTFGNEAVIFEARGDLDKALALLDYQAKICRALGNKPSLKFSLSRQLPILNARGDTPGQLTVLKELAGVCRDLGDCEGVKQSLINRSIILHREGDLRGAIGALREVEQLCRDLADTQCLRGCLSKLAFLLQATGDVQGALASLKEVERLCRELGEMEGLANCLNNQAFLLADGLGRPAQALPLAEEAQRLAHEYGLARLAQEIGPFVDAMQSAVR